MLFSSLFKLYSFEEKFSEKFYHCLARNSNPKFVQLDFLSLSMYIDRYTYRYKTVVS